MNIFATSVSPYASAIALDDKRVVKMIAESTQMLCTAARNNGYDVSGPLSTHIHHPCTVWAGETSGNFRWLLTHLSELHSEKLRRWPNNKPHAWLPVFDQLSEVLVCMETETPRRRQPFVNCARNETLGLDFTDVEDVHEAYRRYLNARWDLARQRACDERGYQQPRWTNREKPEWAT